MSDILWDDQSATTSRGAKIVKVKEVSDLSFTEGAVPQYEVVTQEKRYGLGKPIRVIIKGNIKHDPGD